MLTCLKTPSNAELSLLITTDQEMTELRQVYLGKKGPTNVLSFSQREGIGPDNGLLGDVVVSADTALREARENGLDEYEYFLGLILHGILHLHGYHHERGGKVAALMERLSGEIMELIRDQEIKKLPQ